MTRAEWESTAMRLVDETIGVAMKYGAEHGRERMRALLDKEAELRQHIKTKPEEE